jgi:hypothetical protein
MSKQDLTQYGEQELSLNVMNDEYLYRQFSRCDDEDDLEQMVSGFNYTQEQFDELVSDLDDDRAERAADEESEGHNRHG